MAVVQAPTLPRRRRSARRSPVLDIIRTVFLVGFLLFVLLPLYWVIVTSTTVWISVLSATAFTGRFFGSIT